MGLFGSQKRECEFIAATLRALIVIEIPKHLWERYEEKEEDCEEPACRNFFIHELPARPAIGEFIDVGEYIDHRAASFEEQEIDIIYDMKYFQVQSICWRKDHKGPYMELSVIGIESDSLL